MKEAFFEEMHIKQNNFMPCIYCYKILTLCFKYDEIKKKSPILQLSFEK